MVKPILMFLDPLLQPPDRMRVLCLLLLVTLATAMLYFGSQPGIEGMIPNPPWDKLAHMVAFGGFAALAWVAMGGRSQLGAVVVAGAISLMDEGMQYYTPGRTADFTDIVADLAGAAMVVLILRTMRTQAIRRLAVSRA